VEDPGLIHSALGHQEMEVGIAPAQCFLCL
jgi:hypothetical protein